MRFDRPGGRSGGGGGSVNMGQVQAAIEAAIAPIDPDSTVFRQASIISIQPGATARLELIDYSGAGLMATLDPNDPARISMTTNRLYMMVINLAPLSSNPNIRVTLDINDQLATAWPGKLWNVPYVAPIFAVFSGVQFNEPNYLTIRVRNDGASAIQLDDAGSAFTLVPIARS